MEILLDTCTLLWVINEPEKLPENIINIINDYNNDVFILNTSIWEIELKHLKNEKLIPYDAVSILNSIIDADFRIINLRNEYIMGLKDIVDQHIHNDPFDHILLAMAKEEKMTLITHDESIKKYKGIDIISF